jgi:hypothetical protein
MGGLNKVDSETLAIRDSCFFHNADPFSFEKKISKQL